MSIYYYIPQKITNLIFVKDYSKIDCHDDYYYIDKNKTLSEVLNSLEHITNHNIIIDAESDIFKDIEFKIDESKAMLPSEGLKQDVMSGISLGNSVMLDAIADQKFVILPGRKTSGIRNNLNQNHECIDAIATNGLLSSPKVMSEYSIGKILNAISRSKLTGITMYIIHSALKVDVLSGSGISKYNVPAYIVGKGEILSVFFRYIAILFFPYLTVIDNDNDDNIKYDV